jgi:DNA-binding HxlR family transcriptional regulator
MDRQDQRILVELAFAEEDLTFSETRCRTNIRPNTLKLKLEKLAKDGFIEISDEGWKRGKSKLFRTTLKGHEAAEVVKILQKTEYSPHVVGTVGINQTIQKTLETPDKFDGYTCAMTKEPLSEVVGELPVEVLLWLNMNRHEKTEAVLSNLKEKGCLQEIAFRFFEDLKQAIIKTQNARYNWGGYSSGPYQRKNRLKQEQIGLDFDGTILLHFDGRKIVEKVNWERENKEVEESDRLRRVSYEKFRKAIIKPGLERQNWIIDETIRRTYSTEFAFSRYLAQAFDMFILDFVDLGKFAENPWDKLDSQSKAIERLTEKFTWNVCLRPVRDKQGELVDFLEPSESELARTRSEIRKKIEEMLEEGYIEIVPTYLFRIKDKTKAFEARAKARQSYPLPEGNIPESVTKV